MSNNRPGPKKDTIELVFRCKVDGYKSFDNMDFDHHMERHWEQTLVRITPTKNGVRT